VSAAATVQEPEIEFDIRLVWPDGSHGEYKQKAPNPTVAMDRLLFRIMPDAQRADDFRRQLAENQAGATVSWPGTARFGWHLSPDTEYNREYVVTLPWNPDNPGSDEGDYSTSVWASSDTSAILQVAEEMADHRDSGAQTEQEQAEFAARLVDLASGEPCRYALLREQPLLPPALPPALDRKRETVLYQVFERYRRLVIACLQTVVLAPYDSPSSNGRFEILEELPPSEYIRALEGHRILTVDRMADFMDDHAVSILDFCEDLSNKAVAEMTKFVHLHGESIAAVKIMASKVLGAHGKEPVEMDPNVHNQHSRFRVEAFSPTSQVYVIEWQPRGAPFVRLRTVERVNVSIGPNMEQTFTYVFIRVPGDDAYSDMTNSINVHGRLESAERQLSRIGHCSLSTDTIRTAGQPDVHKLVYKSTVKGWTHHEDGWDAADEHWTKS
jgi:hypothetical protein